jgi:hypothetical protein
MPGLAEELQKVDILSARGAFEASFPGDSHAWKMHALCAPPISTIGPSPHIELHIGREHDRTGYARD